jgi:cytochrome c-type biogenesis protein CcmH/NrfG
MKLLVTAITVTTALAVSSASAQKAACTSENMAKLVTSSNAMPDSPGKFAMMKEMGAANTAMAKGDMRGACKSYMRAQQISGQKKS